MGRGRKALRAGLPARVIAATAAVAWATSAAPALAALDVYPLEGVIEASGYGVLFGSRLPGQTFSGSFTIDRQAMLTGVGSGGQTTTWTGDFSVAIEGVSYPVHSFRVWSGGPVGVADGFEFAFLANGTVGHLSLRSNQDIYDEPLLPAAVEISDMDLLAEILLNPNLPTFVTDRGTVTFVPEAKSGALGLAAVGALLGWRASARHRRVRAAALA